MNYLGLARELHGYTSLSGTLGSKNGEDEKTLAFLQ